MSELTATVHALFEVKENCDFVTRGMELLASDVEAASKHFAAREKKKFFDSYAPGVENIVRNDNELKFTLVYPPSGDERQFVRALSNLGASLMLLALDNNQVGEYWQYGHVNGRKGSYDKAAKAIARVNPTVALGIAVEAGQITKVKQHLAAGADPNARIGLDPLMSVAAANGKHKIVEELLSAGADIDGMTAPLSDSDIKTAEYRDQRPYHRERAGMGMKMLNDGNTALHWAAKKSQHQCMRVLLEAGANVNARNRHQQTPLTASAVEVDGATIALLLEYGAAVDMQDFLGNTAMMIIADKLSTRDDYLDEQVAETLGVLIEAGADTTLRNDKGATARGLSSVREVARLLDQAGAPFVMAPETYIGDPNKDIWYAIHRDDRPKFLELAGHPEIDKQKALNNAAGYGEPEMIRALIEVGADPNVSDRYGCPIHTAAERGHLKAVQALVAAGADMHQQDSLGRDAVVVALKQGRATVRHIGVAQWLIENGWKPTPEGREAALYAAIEIVESDSIIDLLAEGMDLNASSDKYIGNAVVWAARNSAEYGRWTDELGLARLHKILSLGACKFEEEGVFSALSTSNKLCRQALLNAGADINVRLQDSASRSGGYTLLAMACRRAKELKSGESDALWWIEAGADINLATDRGLTPLMIAAWAGKPKLVEALLAAGADLYAKNADGRNALDQCYDKKVRLLLEAKGLASKRSE